MGNRVKDPLAAICRLTFPRYRPSQVHTVALGPSIPVETTWKGVEWRALNMDTGRVLRVPPTTTTLPTDHPEVAFVLRYRPHKNLDYGLRVFLHPRVLGRTALPEQATLATPDRIALYCHDTYLPHARERAARDLGLDPATFYQASRDLVEQDYLRPDCTITETGRAAMSRYWDCSALIWA